MAGMAMDNHGDLIASDRVEGTAVYNRQGERLGKISIFMVDKRSGQVRYALLSFGGFMGIGDDHYPLPWSMLNYDIGRGGYVVDWIRRCWKTRRAMMSAGVPIMTRAMGATSIIIMGWFTRGDARNHEINQ